MKEFIPNELPLEIPISENIYKLLVTASRALSELRGIARTIPNRYILINALALQEAKDSSEIENIITTHDELFLSQVDEGKLTQATKEVQNYQSALIKGFELIKKDEIFKTSHILAIQKRLERNNAGFRRQSGTMLKNPATNEIKHIPPQHYEDIVRLMSNLEQYINDDSMQDLDPLIKMAIIHYQFESIHPFYDGNGRSGRIINVLYLVYKGLLDLPILYLSGYIVRHKAEYYELLQKVRDENAWEEWISYILKGVEHTSNSTTATIKAIQSLMQQTKDLLKTHTEFYTKDFLETLFIHPYTRIESIRDKLKITRQTASKYLKTCEELKIVQCVKIGRNHYYVNEKLCELFIKGIG
ncbi:Fic family protein [Campylobacter sp. MIT 21-1685]|uniref:Fic family protein n=1 Tax=unclassified Campylobacter TaxID=2593542 RepID=UPI00224AD4FF|nr:MULTISPECIES: Fic family protein [unclassified Campylobacter]MCX2683400.1 Fic family protein [Campylobacter sp. MIT 21-1684]MCX2751673.1 Fic family protein [Campylobacter sp. MIT 21-1682]MCX2807874.1 Fic family protein [Campylobacter sp. MIT 21-1685]